MSRSFIAELVVTHPDLPLTPTIEAVRGVTIEVEAQPLADAGTAGPISFFSIEDSSFRRVESALDDDHTVDDWEVILEFEECRTYKIHISSAAKFTTPAIADLGVHILSMKSTERGWRFRLQASDREALGSYWQYCREEDVQFDLEKLYSTGPQAKFPDRDAIDVDLTDRQAEVARTASRMGYFDSDGASAAEVAESLGISPSTLSTHLRRIMGKLFRQLYAES